MKNDELLALDRIISCLWIFPPIGHFLLQQSYNMPLYFNGFLCWTVQKECLLGVECVYVRNNKNSRHVPCFFKIALTKHLTLFLDQTKWNSRVELQLDSFLFVLMLLKNLTFNIRTWRLWGICIYLSGINKTNYVCIYAWIGSQQHMVSWSIKRAA